jgi:hypothetical protein
MGTKLTYFFKKIWSSPLETMKKGFGMIGAVLGSAFRLNFTRSKALAAVVIPIYKASLDENEKISLKQCLVVLGNKYPIIFVAPVSLKVDHYEEFCKGYKNIQFEFFPDFYFRTLDDYSSLMTTVKFYERFYAYQFILIHQLDVFVFSDELEYWCKQDYDYIGSPWLGTNRHNDQEFRSVLPFWVSKPFFRKLFREPDRSVGNGGFSLRKVRSISRSLLSYRFFLRKWQHYEDTFFSIAVPNLDPFFKIPDQQTAIKFGVELQPREAFKMLDEKLPFGCHAWEKREPEFWKPIIESYGYTL